jgi:hypothetical protein
MISEKIIKKAADKAASEFTPILKDTAIKAGWPPYIVNEMVVKEEDGELYIDYPLELTDKINDIEYGTQNSAPNSVLRLFLSRHQSKSDEFSDNVYVDALEAMGALS